MTSVPKPARRSFSKPFTSWETQVRTHCDHGWHQGLADGVQTSADKNSPAELL